MIDERGAQELADEILTQPDEVLLKMVTSDAPDFRPEAITIARDELRLRRISVPTTLGPPVLSAPGSTIDVGGSLQASLARIGARIQELPWPVMIGYVVLIASAVVFFGDPRSRQGERGIYTLAVLMNALVLTEWGVFTKWGQQSGRSQVRAVFWAIMALAWNVNCLMYLVGMRSLESTAP